MMIVRMRLVFIFALFALHVKTASSKSVTTQSQKLMLILLDGFRWDYVEKYDLPNFKRFYSDGVRADKLTSAFPSLSLPNHYSLTTGLFTESHGISSNKMWDRLTNDTFKLGLTDQSKHLHWWEDGWPIWVSVEKQGKVGYSYYWIGAEVNVQNSTPTWTVPYAGRPTIQQFQSSVTDGPAVLNNGTADYVAIFYDNIDSYGHGYGPDSGMLKEELKKVDDAMKTLLDEIGQNANGKINLMVVSDHGMAEVGRSKVINITADILTPDLYDNIMEYEALTTIYLTNSSLEDRVYSLLKDLSPHMTVYKRTDIPERWHYKKGKYVPLIVCVADLGWTIVTPLKPDYPTTSLTHAGQIGNHGYDNDESDMKGIFYAMGPYFKAGASVKSLRIVDLYNVMCGILSITPRPNNGTIQNMTPLLTFKSSAADKSLFISFSNQVIGILVILFNTMND